LSALSRHVLANSFKLQLHIISAAARQWSHLPDLLSLQRNHIIALRCRRAGAVHSIISGQSELGQIPANVRFTPECGHFNHVDAIMA
jgi:hypothetical protein